MPFALHPLSFSWLKHKNISWAIRRHLEAVRAEVKSLSCVRLFVTPWTVPARLLYPWDFPGKITGVGCHFLLQGIFPTQGLNLGLLHCRQTLYRLSHKGNMRQLYHHEATLSALVCSLLTSLELEKLASLGYFGQVFFSFLMNTILTDMVSYFQLDTKCLTFHVLIWTCHILGTQYPHMASDYCIGHGSFRVEQSDLYDIEIHWFILKIFLTKILIV